MTLKKRLGCPKIRKITSHPGNPTYSDDPLVSSTLSLMVQNGSDLTPVHITHTQTGQINPDNGFVYNTTTTKNSLWGHTAKHERPTDPKTGRNILRLHENRKAVDDRLTTKLASTATTNSGRTLVVRVAEKPYQTQHVSSFKFKARHRIRNINFTDEKNIKCFGKCATDHDHDNYEIVVTTATDYPALTGYLERLLNPDHLELLNLNDIIKTSLGTSENVAAFVWQDLADNFFTKATSFTVHALESAKSSASYTKLVTQGKEV